MSIFNIIKFIISGTTKPEFDFTRHLEEMRAMEISTQGPSEYFHPAIQSMYKNNCDTNFFIWLQNLLSKEKYFCTKMEYENSLLNYRCDFSANMDILSINHNVMCRFNVETLNSWIDKENFGTIAFYITALIGIGLLGYYAINYYRDWIKLNTITDKVVTNSENKILDDFILETFKDPDAELIIQQLIDREFMYGFFDKVKDGITVNLPAAIDTTVNIVSSIPQVV